MTEASFARALLAGDGTASAAVTGLDAGTAHRFAVYRNSVTAGLIRNLEAGFPVIRALVGPTFFAEMARQFVLRHPPQQPVMMLYGAAFPEFLANFSAVSAYPYFPDMARLEQALRESYHAADADGPVGLPDLNVLTNYAGNVTVSFAPSLRLVRSDWPIHAIWCFNQTGGPQPMAQGQDVLVLRPEFDPQMHVLSRSQADFMAQLLTGGSLAQATFAAPPDFDATSLLAILAENAAICGIHPL